MSVEPELKQHAARSGFFIGQNSEMQRVWGMLRDIAASDVPILIRGETGAGKEVVARELHALSARARKPFLKLNCAALPSELVESELFGYERGAFTGAFQSKPGMFEYADGGTILLDEIGDMDFRLQAKLLQVLQDHEFQHIGGREPIRVNVRVIAATHRDLEEAMSERLFRDDLYYRLNVVAIEVPPLRDRKEDLIALTEFLLAKHSAARVELGQSFKDALLSYHWPGNVRELENLVRRYVLLRDEEGIVRELRRKMERAAGATTPQTKVVLETTGGTTPIFAKLSQAKQDAERAAILGALNSTRWNRTQAASLLAIDYKALLYKMKTLGIRESAGT